jgi:hypothetical protein
MLGLVDEAWLGLRAPRGHDDRASEVLERLGGLSLPIPGLSHMTLDELRFGPLLDQLVKKIERRAVPGPLGWLLKDLLDLGWLPAHDTPAAS